MTMVGKERGWVAGWNLKGIMGKGNGESKATPTPGVGGGWVLVGGRKGLLKSFYAYIDINLPKFN